MSALEGVTPHFSYQGTWPISRCLLDELRDSTYSEEPSFHRPPEDELVYLEAVADECRMDAEFPRLQAGFQCPYLDETMVVLGALIRDSASESVAEYFTTKRILHRCGIVASVLLGAEHHLPLAWRRLKQNYHELMTLEMSLQTVLDDLVDESCVGTEDAESLLSLFEGGLTGRYEALPVASSRAAVEDVARAVATLHRRRNHLLRELGIPAGPGSVTAILQKRFFATYRSVHCTFSTFSRYLDHRADNCGMPLQSYWAAHWHCRRRGLNALTYEERPSETCAVLRRYACLGGISNDLVGYDKDISEGVATSVLVLRHERGGDVWDAFEVAMAFHNDRLDSLMGALRIRRPLYGQRYVLLFTTLLSAWSIHVLHMEYSARYDMATLRAALRSRTAPKSLYPPGTHA